MCLAVLMSVSLNTHYSDYYDTDYWITIFTLENKTYHIKNSVHKNFCLLSSTKEPVLPFRGYPIV